MFWKKYSHKEVNQIMDKALSLNLNYRENTILGLPASYLDREEFYEDAPFLSDSPYLKVLIENPNHIGVHTFGEGEPAFKGTQEVEQDLIRICAEEIFGGEKGQQDGYVASGGTEANLQAMWTYRNYFMKEFGASLDEIAVVYSEDTHYCVPKGLNIFQLKGIELKVDQEDRSIQLDYLESALKQAKEEGIKYLLVYMNMGTTMFGSVDDVEAVGKVLDQSGLPHKIHVDGAFGGFIYPFSKLDNQLNFKNSRINSVTLDAHKMLQAPYGTGIFLIRKGFMPYVLTEEAGYVAGKDYTLIGSRSGANAVAVWMILRNYGSDGWKFKVSRLIDRTERLCDQLDILGVPYFREPNLNIITLKAKGISPALAKKYLLVPERHDGQNEWWKIVLMEHVSQGAIDKFLFDLKGQLQLA